MKKIEGKIIKDILIDNDDYHFLRFVFDNDEYLTFVVSGDCCSESWFADIIGIHDVINSKISKVEFIPLMEISLYAGFFSPTKEETEDLKENQEKLKSEIKQHFSISESKLDEIVSYPRHKSEYDILYGIKVYSYMGVMTVIFRNSSNGYYGGWLDEIPMEEKSQKCWADVYPTVKFVSIAKNDEWRA